MIINSTIPHLLLEKSIMKQDKMKIYPPFPRSLISLAVLSFINYWFLTYVKFWDDTSQSSIKGNFIQINLILPNNQQLRGQ